MFEIFSVGDSAYLQAVLNAVAMISGTGDYRTAAAVGGGFSCTDVYWSGTATDPTAGQRWAGGQIQATNGTWSQTGLDIRPIAPMMPTVQPLDQIRTNGAATTTPSSAAQTQNILTQNCYALIEANIVPFSIIEAIL